jgi:hypothetical protein
VIIVRKTALFIAATAILLILQSCGRTIIQQTPIKAINDDSEDARIIDESGAGYDFEGSDHYSDEKETNTEEPTNVLKRFQDANNSRDLEALMACYDPEYIEFSQALGEGVGGALSEMFLGVSVKADTSKMTSFFSKMFQKYVQSNDVYAMIELVEISTEYKDDDNATIRYLERVMAQDGSVISENEAEMPVTKIDGMWYISMADVLATTLQELNR